jgi:hypothetical protein
LATPYKDSYSEDRRLAGKNFTCVICSERFNEDDLQYQDGLQSLPVCPYDYEQNGGELARQMAVAEAAELAASLDEKHATPPKEPGWYDPNLVPCISAFSERPKIVTRVVPTTLTLTGIFTTSDTFTYGGANLADWAAPAITDEDGDGIYDQVVLRVEADAGAATTMRTLTHTSGDYSDLYTEVFDVR